KKHLICLELLKICTPIKDIDDRNKYKDDDIKARLESFKSIKYLQELVPKMSQFLIIQIHSDSFQYAKKTVLKTFRSKLGLLNSAHYATYGLKLKATNKKGGPFYENSEDMRYGYSRLSPDELEIALSSDLRI
ncbi:17117_t:CDS:2, partial [Gigaspora rosea]